MMVMVMVMVMIARELNPPFIRARPALRVERAQELAGLVDRLKQVGIGVGS